ncbi:MAG: hypothetical protein Ta2A_23650 [Treponemataceae bacterium]|nr:MAG: hypothetical protein Ta2A_23650 [Treponemataceae bacterium]
MKKSKIPTAALLLLLLVMPQIYAQNKSELPLSQKNDYGIEGEKLYPGTMLIELLAQAEMEIDVAVSEAFAEGYKAAMLEYAPLAEYWKAIAHNAEIKRKDAVRQKWLFALGAFGIGFVVGNGTGIAVGLKL